MYQRLPLSFMERHVDKLYWKYVCIYHMLPVSFMEKNIDKLHWKYVCIFQRLPLYFIEKYKHKMNWKYFAKNGDIDNKIKNRYINMWKQYSDSDINTSDSESE